MTQQFNPIKLAERSETFCVLPWMHQHVGTRGDVKPCCVYQTKMELGNLKEHSLSEIWNNENYKNIRLDVLHGRYNEGCGSCNNRTHLGDVYRDEFNRDFFKNNPGIRDIIASTRSDGHLDTHEMHYIDVRFNNLCNLSCRSCGAMYSTSWIEDSKKLYDKIDMEDVEEKFTLSGKSKYDTLDQLMPHLETAKIIYFAGGEPLMQWEHYEVLKRLDELGLCDEVEIRYNTNFSKFKLKNYDNVLDYWKKFKSVRVSASLDGNHGVAEYWRNGTDWSEIVANRELLEQECPDVHFGISCTVSWPNMLNAIDFHKEWLVNNWIKTDSFWLNIAATPSYYSLSNIPDFKKSQIDKKIQEHIAWLIECGTDENSHTIHTFNTTRKFMWDEANRDPDLDKSLKTFYHITTKLDGIREQSFFDVFPEHTDIAEYIKKLDDHE